MRDHLLSLAGIEKRVYNANMSGKTKNNRWVKTIIRILLRILVALFGIMVIITLLLNIPAIQTYLTSRISTYLEKKLETTVQVEAVRIALPKTVVLNGVYFEDQNKDTLLYLGELSVNVSLFGLLRHEVKARSLNLENLVLRVQRKVPQNEFNFQYIIERLSLNDTLVAPKSEPGKKPKPWDLSVSEVLLQQINVSYYDDVVGIDARLKMDELSIDVNKIDVVELIFLLEDLAMRNTTGSVEMWEVVSENQERETIVNSNYTAVDYRLREVGLDHL